jgi:2,4-dienoyl-CoA reductase-like NADH-dependent reductase (Old Yellow Enzyme family)/thioredoxin reductase
MKLLEPIQIGTMKVKNRIVMPPMGMGYAHEDGSVSERVLGYYDKRAASGVGMVVVENCIIDPDVLGVGPELHLHNDRYIPGLIKLAKTIQKHGAVAGIQLNHMGRQTTLGQPIAPSPIPISPRGPLPKVLSIPEIEYVVEEFVQAARRARDAGFDFVEIHGAHGYLVCEFMSPLANLRTDKYGGSTSARALFPVQIVEGIRKLCPGFPIQFRISGSEYVEGGLTIEENQKIVQKLVHAGVGSVSVSAGNWQTLHYIMGPMFMQPAYLANDAAGIKSATSVPVIAVGRIHGVKVAEQVLQDGKADMVALGRALIADPEWVGKLEKGRPEDIRPCISCNTCVDFVSRALEARCTVNAELGREYDFQLTPTLHKLRVLVVGAGPAGLEAARVARLREHDVTLVERSSRLGGKLHVSAAAPSKGDINNFIDYLSRQCKKTGVRIETERTLSKEDVLAIRPDMILLATGSSPIVPPIPGVKSPTVVVAEDLLMERARVGKRVAIVGGGGTGCETAEYLSARGHQVAILEMMAHIGLNIEAITRRWMFYELRKAGVSLMTKSKVMRIEPDRVIYSDQRGEEHIYECDNVVIALGYRPNDDLDFCDEDFEIPSYRIGDCQKPGTILDAVTAGANIAARI